MSVYYHVYCNMSSSKHLCLLTTCRCNGNNKIIYTRLHPTWWNRVFLEKLIVAKFVYVTERGPMETEHEGILCFLWYPLAFACQSEALVTDEVYHCQRPFDQNG